MMYIRGYIPDTVVYVCKKPEEFTYSNGDKEQLHESVVVDSSNSKGLARARRDFEDYQTKKVFKEFSKENKPMLDIKLIKHTWERSRVVWHPPLDYLCLLSRTDFVWKAATVDGYLFNIDHEDILEALQDSGARSRAILNGTFIWAVRNSKMKLIRVGSPDYLELVKLTEFKNRPRMPKKQITPGGVYLSKSHKKYICLGSPNGCHPFMYANITTYRDDGKTPEQLLEAKLKETYSGYHFDVLKSPVFNEELSRVEFDIVSIKAALRSKTYMNPAAKQMLQGW